MHAKTVPEEAHRHEHAYETDMQVIAEAAIPQEQCTQCMERCVWNASKIGHFIAWFAEAGGPGPSMRWNKKQCQNDARENIELVSINSIHFNKNHSILTASI